MTFEVYPWARHLAKVTLGDLAADLDSQLLQNTLLQEAILTGRCMEQKRFPQRRRWKAEGKGRKRIKRIRELLATFGRRIVLADGDAHFNEIWIWRDGIAQLSGYYDNPSVDLDAYTLDGEECIGAVLRYYRSVTTDIEEDDETGGNWVKGIVESFTGPRIQRLGFVEAPFCEENYTREVVAGYKFALKELTSPNPRGRITIIDGPPGTGKTWLIRSLISEADNTTIVLVPPAMVRNLSEPGYLPSLLESRADEGQPIILVLEDADEILSTRLSSSMGAITAALNMSDGILGQVLDMRIIASTNQPLTEIDPAMRRAGRLSSRIEVLPLPRAQAAALFTAKTGRPEDDMVSIVGAKREYPLADIYKAQAYLQDNQPVSTLQPVNGTTASDPARTTTMPS